MFWVSSSGVLIDDTAMARQVLPSEADVALNYHNPIVSLEGHKHLIVFSRKQLNWIILNAILTNHWLKFSLQNQSQSRIPLVGIILSILCIHPLFQFVFIANSGRKLFFISYAIFLSISRHLLNHSSKPFLVKILTKYSWVDYSFNC